MCGRPHGEGKMTPKACLVNDDPERQDGKLSILAGSINHLFLLSEGGGTG